MCFDDILLSYSQSETEAIMMNDLTIPGVVATQDGILGAKIHCNGFESFKRKRFVKVTLHRCSNSLFMRI